jgi:hypothetical protein
VSLLSLFIACSGPTTPMVAAVSFVYVSRFPDGCPNPDAGFCFHHNAPAGLQVLVPLWGPDPIPMSDAGVKRWQVMLPAVPVGVALRLQVRDIQGCCFGGLLVLHDVFANGVLLTRVVQDQANPALEFRVGPDGSVSP